MLWKLPRNLVDNFNDHLITLHWPVVQITETSRWDFIPSQYPNFTCPTTHGKRGHHRAPGRSYHVLWPSCDTRDTWHHDTSASYTHQARPALADTWTRGFEEPRGNKKNIPISLNYEEQDIYLWILHECFMNEHFPLVSFLIHILLMMKRWCFTREEDRRVAGEG